MVIARFPPVELADEHGLLAVGGDLEPESLLLAYSSGIFPWPIDQQHLTWFAPAQRAVLFLDAFKPNKSLRRALSKKNFSFRINTNFKAVISACAELTNRGKQKGTWLTSAMQKAYIRFHQAGYCHSIECYQGDELVGGLYGVSIGKFFAGESMFYRVPDASKTAFSYLVTYLRERSVAWIDCQVMTPFLKNLGAVEVERTEYMLMLQRSLRSKGSIF